MKFEDEFDVVPPEGNVFVNHEINGRSGHCLREKIKDHANWKIATIWGIGYKFEVR